MCKAREHMTPLMFSAAGGYIEVARTLISAGALVDVRDKVHQVLSSFSVLTPCREGGLHCILPLKIEAKMFSDCSCAQAR